MSATLEHPTPLLAQRPRPTLEQTLEGAWRDALRSSAECPLCHGPMTLHAAEAECSDCGTRLS